MEIIEKVTLPQIREANPPMIFYGANTCWWTHDPAHLVVRGVPTDPRGGVLFETDDVQGFLDCAEANALHYGKHGIRAFLAAHHMNAIQSLSNPIPWCDERWQAYNDALDRLIVRIQNETVH